MASVFNILVLISIAQFVSAKIDWNGLKITFPKFTNLPRTKEDANAEGFISLNTATDCTNGGKFNGYRYISPSDPSVAILYDAQGFVAGLQANYLKKEILTKANNFNFDAVTMFQTSTIQDNEYHTITAYFVDPKTICTTGRTPQQFQVEGTGNSLYFQNGPTPSDLIQAPLNRQEAMKEGWSKNPCFIGMGYHSFYKSDEFGQSNCTEIRPVFLLYNDEYDGELHGFGFSTQGFANSPHFEHPPSFALSHTIGPNVAQCLKDAADAPGLTTMHVYFINFWSMLSNTLCF